MSDPVQGSLEGKDIHVALIVSRFNELVTGRLLSGAEDCLERHGCAEKNRTVVRVPGSWELPLVAKRLATTKRFDAIVALGALVRGETPHFDLVAAETARGVARAGLDSGVPVVLGIVTAESADQAAERAGGKVGNRGFDAALSAIEMVDLLRRLEA